MALLAPAVAAAAPSNDAFAEPRLLVGGEAKASGVTFAATKEQGEPDHAGDSGGASVWFSWTAPRAAHAFLQICTFEWRGLVAVYRGSSLGSLELVASSSSLPPGESCRQVRFLATGGVTYRIALDGYSDGGTTPAAQGEYELSLSDYTFRQPGEPGNDAFASAFDLGSREAAFFGGSTEGATREPGEPGHAGDLAGASVWYRWTAPKSTMTRVFPCRGGFHSVISVFAGSALGAVTPVGAPAAPGPGVIPCQLGGRGGVAFSAIAGVTYSISVDGENGEWGSYAVELHPVPGPFLDRFPPGTYIHKLQLRGRQAKIRFTSSDRPSTFLCKLDGRPFTPCTSPKTYRRLEIGKHRFAVKSTDGAGNVDATPAVRRFTVREK